MSRLFPAQAVIPVEGYLSLDGAKLVPVRLELDQDADTVSCKLNREALSALDLPAATPVTEAGNS